MMTSSVRWISLISEGKCTIEKIEKKKKNRAVELFPPTVGRWFSSPKKKTVETCVRPFKNRSDHDWVIYSLSIAVALPRTPSNTLNYFSKCLLPHTQYCLQKKRKLFPSRTFPLLLSVFSLLLFSFPHCQWKFKSERKKERERARENQQKNVWRMLHTTVNSCFRILIINYLFFECTVLFF